MTVHSTVLTQMPTKRLQILHISLPPTQAIFTSCICIRIPELHCKTCKREQDRYIKDTTDLHDRQEIKDGCIDLCLRILSEHQVGVWEWGWGVTQTITAVCIMHGRSTGHNYISKTPYPYRMDVLNVHSHHTIFDLLLLHHKVTDELHPQSLQQLHILATNPAQQHPWKRTYNTYTFPAM